METADWEPRYGFCGMNLNDNEVLARSLEAIRRNVCAYGGGDMCDCKYGRTVGDEKFGGKWGDSKSGTARFFSSEQTGCPELREVINRLMHRPDTLGMGADATREAEQRGYSRAVKQFALTLEQMGDPRNAARFLG
jgi:hypothetical protein